MLCLTGTTGNIGSAVLRSLLSHSLIPPSQITIATSSPSTPASLTPYASSGITIRHAASFDDPTSLEAAYTGCDTLFLVSSPKIALDFGDAKEGEGRERHHFAAIDAARKVGVTHIYYTSLAFAFNSTLSGINGKVEESKAGVMRAHERTERYLAKVCAESNGQMGYTVVREGLYAESWPLYFGQWDVLRDERRVVKVGGDGRVAWTGIEDLGLGTALILAGKREEWVGRTVYLSAPRSATLAEVAEVVSRVGGKEVKLEVVGRAEYERLSVQDRGMDEAFVKWWAGSYDALGDGECDVKDSMLENLLKQRGKECAKWEEIVEKMVKGEMSYSSSEGRRG